MHVAQKQIRVETTLATDKGETFSQKQIRRHIYKAIKCHANFPLRSIRVVSTRLISIENAVLRLRNF